MRIAQVAPLFESVPPKLYGGTERVVSFLTEELVRLGHQVTLFASADSRTSATLVPVCPEALRLRGSCVDQVAMHVMMLERVAARAHEFDVIHFHIIATSLSGDASAAARSACDNAARAPRPGGAAAALRRVLRYASRVHFRCAAEPVARRGMGCDRVSRSATGSVQHCIRTSGTYLAFLGRISPEKRVDRAIAIATASGLPLKIAAKVDPADQDLLRTHHRPAARQSARRVHRRDFRKEQERVSRPGESPALPD